MISSGNLVDLSAGISVDSDTFDTDLENSIKVLEKFLKKAEEVKKFKMPTVEGAPGEIAGMIGLFTKATAPAHLVTPYKKKEFSILLEKLKNTYAEAAYSVAMKEILSLIAEYPELPEITRRGLHQLVGKLVTTKTKMRVSTLQGELAKLKGLHETPILEKPEAYFTAEAERVERKVGGPGDITERLDLMLKEVTRGRTRFFPTELKVFTEPKIPQVIAEAIKVYRETLNMKSELQRLATDPDYVKKIGKYLETPGAAPLGKIVQEFKSRILGRMEGKPLPKRIKSIEDFFKSSVIPRLEVFTTEAGIAAIMSSKFEKARKQAGITTRVVPRPLEDIERRREALGLENIVSKSVKRLEDKIDELGTDAEDMKELTDAVRDMVNSWKERTEVR